MKEFITKYIGIFGFIIALVGASTSAYYKFYLNDEFETIGIISFLFWVSIMTIGNELNKKNPKKVVCLYYNNFSYYFQFLVINLK